jgi:hypothetical protein
LRAEEELRITLDAYTSPIRSCRSFNRASLRKVSGGAPEIGTAAFKEHLAEVPLTLIDVRIAIDSYTLPIPNCRSFNRASLSRFRQGSGGAPKIGKATFTEQLAEVPLTLLDSVGTADRWTQTSATASPFGVLAAPLSTNGAPKQAPPSHTAPH